MREVGVFLKVRVHAASIARQLRGGDGAAVRRACQSEKGRGRHRCRPLPSSSGFQYQSKLRFTVNAQVRGSPGE